MWYHSWGQVKVDKLVAWCEAVELAIAQHGLNATPEQ